MTSDSARNSSTTSLAPPFTRELANAKVKKAQDLWNGQLDKVMTDLKTIAQAYIVNSIWRNQSVFLAELFAFIDDKIAVQFWREYQDAHDSIRWERCYGLEDWTFADDGKMCKRQMNGNDIEINGDDRWLKDGVNVNEVEVSEAHW
ncbi:uncharacterized protein M421DRAFT_100479 [Didymella exigua CBS 183.55]|uniref:DUF1348-domain-containing protein n=1 Tax=Didymella exigua CBS 183.55 TaxID=1150837 RepID=A0A6A5RSQ6_9PLEO|nr:uncharacterized protein M421DRAFT_100479 [Didymella exigua CBS 183.55]KAF1929376.1 hypothetical protein M421DRAFT_100479 [Didymella exigua CBS 183.55]